MKILSKTNLYTRWSADENIAGSNVSMDKLLRLQIAESRG